MDSNKNNNNLISGHNDCNLCEKTFQGKNAKRDLKNHMKTHSAPLAPLVPKEISKEFRLILINNN